MAFKINCKRFIFGCEKIDKKRKDIKRIFGIVFTLLDKSDIIDWISEKDGEVFLRITLHKCDEKKIQFHLSLQKKEIVGSIITEGRAGKDSHTIKNTEWTTSSLDDIPFKLVPIVYENLSKIVSEIDEDYPQANIFEEYRFVHKQIDFLHDVI